MTQNTQVTSARERRKLSSFTVVASPELTVRMRRLDMPAMILMGIIPLPMLRAASKFEDLQGKITEESTALDVLNLLAETDQKEFIGFLRDFACKIVIDPVIVLEDDGNEDHLPADNLTVQELMAIWNASPGKEAPIVTTQSAEEFRRPEPAVSADDAPAGEVVRPETQLVVDTERDFITA